MTGFQVQNLISVEIPRWFVLHNVDSV